MKNLNIIYIMRMIFEMIEIQKECKLARKTQYGWIFQTEILGNQIVVDAPHWENAQRVFCYSVKIPISHVTNLTENRHSDKRSKHQQDYTSRNAVEFVEHHAASNKPVQRINKLHIRQQKKQQHHYSYRPRFGILSQIKNQRTKKYNHNQICQEPQMKGIKKY